MASHTEFLTVPDAQDVFSKDGLVDELKKALSEKILNAELNDYRLAPVGLSEWLSIY